MFFLSHLHPFTPPPIPFPILCNFLILTTPPRARPFRSKIRSVQNPHWTASRRHSRRRSGPTKWPRCSSRLVFRIFGFITRSTDRQERNYRSSLVTVTNVRSRYNSMYWFERTAIDPPCQDEGLDSLTEIRDEQYKQHAAEVKMSLPSVPTVFM